MPVANRSKQPVRVLINTIIEYHIYHSLGNVEMYEIKAVEENMALGGIRRDKRNRVYYSARKI